MHTPFLLFSWPTLAHTFHFSSLLHFRAPSTPPSSKRPPPLFFIIRRSGWPRWRSKPSPARPTSPLTFLPSHRPFLNASPLVIFILCLPASSTFNGGKGKASTFLAFFESCFHFDECFLIFSFSFGSFETASTILADFRPFSGDGELDISKQLRVQVWVSSFLSISLLFYEIRREGG